MSEKLTPRELAKKFRRDNPDSAHVDGDSGYCSGWAAPLTPADAKRLIEYWDQLLDGHDGTGGA